MGLADRHGRDRTDTEAAARGDRGAANDRRHDDAAVPPRETVVGNARRSGAAISALILGIIAAVLALIPILGLVGSLLGVVAIILGIVGIVAARKPDVKGVGMAVAGLVLGIISIALGAAGVALVGEAVQDVDPQDAVDSVENEVDELTE